MLPRPFYSIALSKLKVKIIVPGTFVLSAPAWPNSTLNALSGIVTLSLYV